MVSKTNIPQGIARIFQNISRQKSLVQLLFRLRVELCWMLTLTVELKKWLLETKLSLVKQEHISSTLKLLAVFRKVGNFALVNDVNMPDKESIDWCRIVNKFTLSRQFRFIILLTDFRQLH